MSVCVVVSRSPKTCRGSTRSRSRSKVSKRVSRSSELLEDPAAPLSDLGVTIRALSLFSLVLFHYTSLVYKHIIHHRA